MKRKEVSLESHLTAEMLWGNKKQICASTQMETSKEQSRGDWKAWLYIQAATNRHARGLGREENAWSKLQRNKLLTLAEEQSLARAAGPKHVLVVPSRNSRSKNERKFL